MRIPSMLKQSRPKQFEFKPRYYDAQKEELDERVARIEREYKLEQKNATSAGAHLKGSLRNQWSMESRRVENKRSNFTIAAIVAILSALAYYYLYI